MNVSNECVCLKILQSQHSNTREVTLVNVSRKLTGKYKCEISADAPSFHTVIKAAQMRVAGKWKRFFFYYFFYFPTLHLSFSLRSSFRNLWSSLAMRQYKLNLFSASAKLYNYQMYQRPILRSNLRGSVCLRGKLFGRIARREFRVLPLTLRGLWTANP